MHPVEVGEWPRHWSSPHQGRGYLIFSCVPPTPVARYPWIKVNHVMNASLPPRVFPPVESIFVARSLWSKTWSRTPVRLLPTAFRQGGINRPILQATLGTGFQHPRGPHNVINITYGTQKVFDSIRLWHRKVQNQNFFSRTSNPWHASTGNIRLTN